MKNQFKKTSLYIHTHTYSLGVKCVVENFSRQLYHYISITITALRAILLLHSPCIPRLYPSLLLHVKSALNVYLGNRTSSIVNRATYVRESGGHPVGIRIYEYLSIPGLESRAIKRTVGIAWSARGNGELQLSDPSNGLERRDATRTHARATVRRI